MTVHPILKQTPRVLIVENDPRTRESLKALISHWGYKPVIAEGEGETIIDDAIQKAKDERCQIAIVDMRLIDDFDITDRSGLELVQELKPALSIVTSGYGDEEVVSESLEERGASAFVGKQRGPKALKEKLEKVIQTTCAIKKDFAIEPFDVVDQVSKTMFKGADVQYSDQIADVLAKLFPSVNGLRIEKLGKVHQSSNISIVPRPKSVILKVYERVGELEKQPILVKLARAEKIDKEVSRYENFIRRQLVGRYTANLEGSTCVWDIGGAIYSYFGDTDVIPFSHYFQNEDIINIKHSLEHFFTITWSAHYQKAKVVNNVSLFDLYCQVWGTEWHERAIKLQDVELNIFMGKERWEELNAIHPIKWLKKYILEEKAQDVSKVDKTFVTVTHGDLHGDNMLIDKDHIAWVIDFERTQEGHALQDFVELEADIINRIECSSDNFTDFYRLCILITGQKEINALKKDENISGDQEIQKVFDTVSIIRSIARESTAISNFREYLFGLLFNTIFRATITPNEPLNAHQQRALMLASIICHRLEHWGEPWPPKEWQRP
jgi:CheY-like chemotaxis protein